ncbi:MAG: hypothetical protein LQ351_005791, partial [Letrouitia transgressa]
LDDSRIFPSGLYHELMILGVVGAVELGIANGAGKALHSPKAQDKGAELWSSSRASLRESDYDNSTLWSEVFDLFASSNESTDLKAIAKLLRCESKAQDTSRSTNRRSKASNASREWHLCNEVKRIAETRKSELENGARSPFKRQLRHAYDEIVTWAEKFVALGDVISQADPMHIGLPWAGIRAILIISVHDRKTQAEILDGVAYLSRLVCRYAAFEDIYLQDQSSLQVSLELKLKAALKTLYLTVLKYLVEVILYFDHSMTARSLRSITLSDLLRQRYSDINKAEEEVLRYETISIKAASYNQYIEVRRILCTYEDNLESEKRKAICDWISKTAYYSYHREMKEKVLSETGQWLLERNEFRDWIGRDQSSLLWLKGNGMPLYVHQSNNHVVTVKLFSWNGKDKFDVSFYINFICLSDIKFTGDSTCVVESFLQKPWLDSREVMAYFYCSRTTSDTRRHNPRTILLSILRQLAAPFPGLPLRPLIVSVYDREAARGSQEAQLSIEEIKNLLVDLIEHHYQNVTLVVDALDECDAMGRSELLNIFTTLTYNPNTIVKTIVSSRSDPDIENHFMKTPNISITAADNAGDIMRFVSKEINQRLLDGKASKQIKERVENHLNERANGVFRWVAMQIDTLCDPDYVYGEDDIKYLLSKLPGTLEETYAKALNDLDGLPPPSREAIKNTCKLLLCAESPMYIFELVGALAILSGSQKAVVNKAAILKMARGLIVEELGQDRLIFAHLSVREFLETKVEFSGQRAHLVAAEACLKYYLMPEIRNPETSGFRLYAVNFIGRHCMKSGTLRQATKLQGLMEEFLLAKDSNDAFKNWNRDCFDELHIPPGIESEIEWCMSSPASPLFMACVYGFNDFVGPIIKAYEGALFAECYYGKRPLEVTALHGNFETMVILYNAISPTDLSSVRAEWWLVAAAYSCKLDIWNYAIKQISNIPLDTALVEAARSPFHGKEMISSLSNYEINVNETLLGIILKSCASFEALDMILTFYKPGRFTESALEAAILNPHINPKLTEMILSKNPWLRVSETCILSAPHALDYASSIYRTDRRTLKERTAEEGMAILRTLLNHPTRCEITEELVNELLHTGILKGDSESLNLILQHCSVDFITEDLLVSAASTMTPAHLNNFLNHPLGHTITQPVLQSAGRNSSPIFLFNTLHSRPKCPPLDEETVYFIMETWQGCDGSISNLVNKCESMYVTDAYIQTCAANAGVKDLYYTIFLPRAIPISKDVLCAAVMNREHPRGVLEFLLEIKSGLPDFVLEPSEELLFQALSNSRTYQVLDLLKSLSKDWDFLPVSERSLVAAFRIHEKGPFEFLLQHCDHIEEFLSDNVLLAAIESGDPDRVEFYIHNMPKFEVKESFLEAAINGDCTNNAVLRILLSELCGGSITRSVLETAVESGKESALELLLEQPGVSEVYHKVSNDIIPKSAPADTDEGTTFDAILSAASKRGELTSKRIGYLYELSTRKLEFLVAKYRGPSLDTNRLVEVAAERRDGKFVVQYLLSHFPETIVTQRAIFAAVSNEEALASLLDFLLKHFHGSIDPKLLQLAAGNKKRGTQMVEILLARDPDINIDGDVLTAALGNSFCARTLLNLFLRRRPDLAVTQDIIDAASENKVLDKVLLQMLLKRALTIRSTSSADLVFQKMKCIANGLRDSLFMAACYGEDEVLKFLISHSVSISAVSGELGTALNVAVYAQNVEAVEILLIEGSDPESRSKLYGSPLETACRKGDLSIVRILARHGADIDRPNNMGRTVLHKAAKYGSYDLVDLLISLGASTVKQDRQGMAAMHRACLYTKSADCVHRLIESGASVDQEDSHKWTPLHWAAKSGAINAISRLLEAGASKYKVDASGRSPLEIAFLCGNFHLRPQLFLPDAPNLATGPVGKAYIGFICDACELVHDPGHHFEQLD